MDTLTLSKAVLADLDPADVARYLVGGEAGITLMLALSTVESYLAEAAVQQARIQREQKALRRALEQLRRTAVEVPPTAKTWGKTLSRANRFRAVHFYLTCWRMVGRHLVLIRDVSRLPEVQRALQSHVQTLKDYQAMRDHYEHFDERLPGQKNVRRLTVKNDLGNFQGYTLTFGGKRIDVGPDSMRLLKKIVSNVLLAFKVGAVKKLATENPEGLQGLVATIRARRIYRTVRRMFG